MIVTLENQQGFDNSIPYLTKIPLFFPFQAYYMNHVSKDIVCVVFWIYDTPERLSRKNNKEGKEDTQPTIRTWKVEERPTIDV